MQAVGEPVFSEAYTQLIVGCWNGVTLIKKQVVSVLNPNGSTNFRSLLLNRCQNEFQRVGQSFIEFEKAKKECQPVIEI